MPVGTARRGLIRPASMGGDGGGVDTRRVRRRLRLAMESVCHATPQVQLPVDVEPDVDLDFLSDEELDEEPLDDPESELVEPESDDFDESDLESDPLELDELSESDLEGEDDPPEDPPEDEPEPLRLSVL